MSLGNQNATHSEPLFTYKPTGKYIQKQKTFQVVILFGVKNSYAPEMSQRNRERTLFDPRQKVQSKAPKDSVQKLNEVYQFIATEEKRLDQSKYSEFEARETLLEKYDLVILENDTFAIKYDLERRKWKYGVYQLISTNREGFKTGRVNDSLELWQKYLVGVVEKYQKMYVILQKKQEKPQCWSTLNLRMGDIYRYLALYIVSDDKRSEYWDKAAHEYQTYSQLVPGNGLVWNQLGIVSAVRKRYVVAVRNYLYALSIPKPFESAREALLELFHLIGSADVKNSMIIDDFDDSSIIHVEKLFVLLQNTIFTKIGLDQFQHRLEQFTMGLQSLGGLYQLDINVQVKWWFELAMISILNACVVIRSRTFDQVAKNLLLAKSFDVSFVIMTFGLTLVPDQSVVDIFVEMLLLWITTCGSLEPFKKDFELAWQILEYRYPPIEPTATKVDDIVASIRNETGILPEDSLYRESLPFILLASSESMKNPWSVYFEFTEQRKTRIRKLLGYLLHKRISATEITKEVVENSNSVHIKTEFTFEDFDEDVASIEKSLQPPKNTLFDEIEALEESEDVKLLKSRKQVLKSSIVEKQDRMTLKKEKSVLVFDTNLILGSFEKIQSIIESKAWRIVIPLAVLMEIEGLQGKEAYHLSSTATHVVGYIESSFQNNLFTVRTTTGKLVRDLRFRTEEWGKDIRSADDAILETCRSIENACLVTDDRNLRLKATTAGIYSFGTLNKIQ
jgi:rRNA-processing protein FCF1